MASGSTAMLRRAAQDCLCQASAEHFQQCAEFLPLRNRGLGPLAVPVLPIPFARRAAVIACAAVENLGRSRVPRQHQVQGVRCN